MFFLQRRNKQPSGATAKCRDRTWSFSQSSRGTCSSWWCNCLASAYLT
ncbi:MULTISPECIES: DUF3761 domain-containing protein [Acinetobacter Taxon 24]|nr:MULTISPECIES: DUF3761 domain-containing protein [Acinetobacter Taxon 24]